MSKLIHTNIHFILNCVIAKLGKNVYSGQANFTAATSNLLQHFNKRDICGKTFKNKLFIICFEIIHLTFIQSLLTILYTFQIPFFSYQY